MDSLTVVTAVVWMLMIFLTICVLLELAFLPGRIAERRGHPHPKAVRITGGGWPAGGRHILDRSPGLGVFWITASSMNSQAAISDKTFPNA